MNFYRRFLVLHKNVLNTSLVPNRTNRGAVSRVLVAEGAPEMQARPGTPRLADSGPEGSRSCAVPVNGEPFRAAGSSSVPCPPEQRAERRPSD